jgi:ABC-type transport system involved in multi-copper enzyme maturation permease subunit
VRAVSRVAVNVFRESVRDRVPYNLVLFAVLLISSSYLLGQLTAGQDIKIIKDLGLSATSVFGLFIAIFIGIGLVSKEVERRSIYALLSKPISRPQFIAGKYTGLVLTLAVNVAVMTAALYAVLAYMTWTESPQFKAAWDAPGVDPALLKALFLIFVQLMIVTAVALFFSTFSSSALLSVVFTLGVFVAGLLSADLRGFGDIVEVTPLTARLVETIGWIVPAFSAFDIKAQVVHGLMLPSGFIGYTLGYAALYICGILVAAVTLFSRREFQ